jgi:hypothetical protein
MTVEYEGGELYPAGGPAGYGGLPPGESIILKIEQDENGDDIYATIEDEDEYQKVFEKCLKLMEEEDGEGEE